MSKKRNFVLLGLLSAAVGGSYALTSYLYDLSLVPKKKTEEDINSDPDDAKAVKWLREYDKKEDAYIKSLDELSLHATLLNAETGSHKYAICIHGVKSDGEYMAYYAKHYIDNGINVLLPDNRGFGKSEGNYTGYGYFDRLDIMEWIYFILRRDKDAKIMLHGTSMGAAITLMTTGEHLPDQVVMAVSDSSYTSLKEEFADVYKTLKLSVIPSMLVLLIMRAIVLFRCGYDIDKVNCLNAVSRSKTPTLFIHGDEDRLIDPQMCARLYEACSAPKQYCLILGADHVKGAYVDPDKYWKKVHSLMEKTGF